MSAEAASVLADLDERDWNPSTKTGWFAMAETPARRRPRSHTAEELAAMTPRERKSVV